MRVGSFWSPKRIHPRPLSSHGGARLLGAFGLETHHSNLCLLVTGRMSRGTLLVCLSLWHFHS